MRHYHTNPRQITRKEMDQLKKDLAELGDLGGYVHDLDTDEIVGGNQRAEAMGLVGVKIEPVITQRYDPPNAQGTVAVGYFEWQGEQYKYRAVRGWDDKTRQRANIRANKAGGDWDWDVLANAFDPADLTEWGFDMDTLQDWKRDVGALGNFIESNEAPQFSGKYYDDDDISNEDAEITQKNDKELTELVCPHCGGKLYINPVANISYGRKNGD